jgi:hypothetical protein
VAAVVWQHGNSSILKAAVVTWQCQWWWWRCWQLSGSSSAVSLVVTRRRIRKHCRGNSLVVAAVQCGGSGVDGSGVVVLGPWRQPSCGGGGISAARWQHGNMMVVT